MTSCLVLERPGAWRPVAAAALFAAAVLPAVPLVLQAAAAEGEFGVGRGFGSALWNSLTVALPVVVGSWILGLVGGVLAALYEFPGRRALLALASLPLLVPSFLWALGWSALLARLAPSARDFLSGRAGCVLVFTAGTFPLVWLSAYMATLGLTGSQVEAARLAGGERAVLVHACRHAAPLAGLAAALGGVLTLSDPGPGLILGMRTAAGEVLTSFSALYDFRLAGLQCLLLSGVVFLLAGPLVCLAAPRLADQMLARQTRPAARFRGGPRAAAFAGFVAVLALLVGLPLSGLLLPVLEGRTAFPRAWEEVARTGPDTLLYAGGSGLIATVLGLLLAACVGRSRRLLVLSLGLCLLLFALPPALPALGFVHLSAQAPDWSDPLVRSEATVCLALGLRFFSVAALLGLRAWGAMPASWALAGAVHGVPLGRYLLRVVLPHLLPAAGASLLLVGLLATAEVGTVLLVHPPGRASLPLAVFTVMANAPEALVASLCLLYIALAAGVLVPVWTMAGREKS